MSKICEICGRGHSMFRLELEADDGSIYTLPLCGTCWDIIAEVAKLASRSLAERVAELERRIKKIQEMFPSTG